MRQSLTKAIMGTRSSYIIFST